MQFREASAEAKEEQEVAMLTNSQYSTKTTIRWINHPE